MPVDRSAGAVIFRKEDKNLAYGENLVSRFARNNIKYLLIQYEAGHWGFPRGLIEKGEKMEETAYREIEEEVGIKDIEFIQGFKEWVKFFYKFKGKNIMKIATFFLAETQTKEIKLSFEHKNYVWLEYGDALKKLNFKNSKEILKKANDFLKK